MKHSLTPTENKYQFLARCDLCRGLDAEERWRMADHLEAVTVERGELVCEEGEPGDRLYVVGRGLLEVFLEAPEGTRPVGRLGPGDHFGELALLEGGRRTASIRATSPATLLSLDRDAFDELMSTSPRFATNLSRALGSRLQATNAGRFHAKAPRVVAHVHGCGDSSPVLRAVAERVAAHAPGAWLRGADVTPERIDALRAEHAPVFLELDGDHAKETVLAAADEIWWWLDVTAVLPASVAEFLHRSERLAARSRPVWVSRTRSAAPREEGESPFGLDELHAHVDDGGRRSRFAAKRLGERLLGRELGVALGGGGSRGLAHLGVLHELEQAGITPDRIAGTSSGALMGLIYAAGMPTEEAIEMLVRELSPGPLLRRLPASSRLRLWASFRSGGFERKLRKYFGGTRLESLPIPCATVAVDLITGNTVVRDRGDAVEAVLESINLPVFAKPIMRDGMALVDGGVLNNLPADVLAAGGADAVIGVDVMAGLPGEEQGAGVTRPGPLDAVLRVLEVQQRRLTAASSNRSDVRVAPEVSRFDFTDFGRGEEIYYAGRLAARDALDAILELTRASRPGDTVGTDSACE